MKHKPSKNTTRETLIFGFDELANGESELFFELAPEPIRPARIPERQGKPAPKPH